MNREYDLFERMSDGSLTWKGFTKGLDEARSRLGRLASETANECFAIDVTNGDIVARVNTPAGAKDE